MKLWARYGAWGLGAFVALALASATARADTVNIMDLTEAIPTIQVISGGVDVTATRVIPQPDTTLDYLHVKLVNPNVGDGELVNGDLFEDFVGGTLSDRLQVFIDPNADINGLDVVFDSRDPVNTPGGNTLFQAVEDGTLQGPTFTIFNTNIGDGTYSFFIQSDVESSSVPEIDPGSMAGAFTVLAGGMLTLRGRRRKV
jgi:hypothetical protein